MIDGRALECVVFVGAQGAPGLWAAVDAGGGRVVKAEPRLLMAVFDDAGAAVGFLRQAVAAPGARAGADVGDVSHEDGDVFGMTVHVAKRLCERAAPGTALVSRHTAALARVDAPAAGELDLRGVGAPVAAAVLESGPPPHASGRLHAVVVTDLVGSTAMRATIGDGAADELRREHFRSLAALAEGHRGEVVRTTGDGLVLRFASLVDAAAAALACQRVVARERRVTIRVGLEIADEAAAARMCDAGPPAGVATGPLAAELLRPHREFSLTPSDSGFLLAGGTASAPLPLPPALTVAPRGSFVGREQAMETVRTWLDSAHAGEGLLVLLAGEAGIGKSRLARETVARMHGDGHRVLFGRCDEQPLAHYQPFVEALGHYAEVAPIDDLALRTRGLPQLAPLVPRLSQRLPGLRPPTSDNPEEDRFRLFEAVTALLAGIARDGPLVLLIEDLHWADASTLQLLRHLARAAAGSGLAILGTYRSSEVGRRHPLAAVAGELRERGLLERLDLHGLDDRAVVQLVAERLGAARGGVGEAVLERTEGNPFFVLEMLRHMEEAGVGNAAGVPDGVREVVARRLERLGDTAARLLATGGVAGREFDRALIARASDVDPLDALDALEDAVAAEVLVDVPGSPGRYRFSHALIRDAVEEGLGHDRRALVHLRLALALEGQGGDAHLTELSRHFVAAGPGGDAAKAVHYAMRAGQQALALLAHDEAARQFESALQALDWCAPDERNLRAELQLALAAARIAAGDRARARAAATQAAVLARQAGDAPLLARAALWAEGGWVPVGSSDPVTVELLEEAKGMLQRSDNPLRVRVLAAHAMQTYYLDTAAAMTSSAEAVELARRAGDDDALGRALHAQHYTLRGQPQHLDERLAIVGELLELAVRRGDREQEGLARMWGASDLVEAGDLPAFDAELDRLRAAADELRRTLYAYWVSRLQIMRALMVGDFGVARDLLPRAEETGRKADEPNTLPQLLVQRATLAHAVGAAAPVADEIEARELRPRTGWSAILAWLLAPERPARAAEMVESLVDGGLDDVADDAFAPMILCHVAEVVAALERAELVPALTRRLERFGDGNVLTPTATTYVGPLPFFRGLLHATVARHEPAVVEFGRAWSMAHALRARPLMARIALASSRSLAATGDHAAAVERARWALEMAKLLGMVHVESAARDALAGRAGA